MESNKLHKNNDFTIKKVIYAFLPFLFAVLIQYFVIISNIVIIFLKNVASNERSGSLRSVGEIISQDYNQPMNSAFISMSQYLLYIIVFGMWYYNAFYKKTISHSDSPVVSIKRNFRKIIISVTTIFLIIAGFAGQLFVDSILTLSRPHFTSAFAEYDKLVSSVVGVTSSSIMLISVLLLAPIGEELLFRGLVLKYTKTFMPVPFAIVLQGLLFGIYHGNMIQGIYAFALGSVLGLVAHKFDSVLPAIILHMAINISLLFVPEFLLETTALCIVTCIVALAIFIAMIALSFKKRAKLDNIN